METYRYKNAIINIHGEVDQEKLKEATIKFMKKSELCRKNKIKEKNRNGNKNSSGTV